LNDHSFDEHALNDHSFDEHALNNDHALKNHVLNDHALNNYALNEPAFRIFKCGGALLNKFWVFTAAMQLFLQNRKLRNDKLFL
jgi:hypothetical protein